MKQILLSFYITILLVFCSYHSYGDVSPLVLATHFSKLENYDAAITEYKRFLFFHSDDDRVPEIYHKIGIAYRQQGLLEEAIGEMRQAVMQTSDRELKSEYQVDLAVTLLANQDYDLARLELIKATIRRPSTPLYRRALLLQGVTYIYQFRWDKAREVLQIYTNDDTLDELFNKASNLPRKSPKIANIFSIILPGAGQTYAGNLKDGLNALALNGIFGYVAIDSILDKYYGDAILWTYFIFLRYYQGNLYRAGKAVDEYNQNLNRSSADSILKRLQEIVNTP